MMMLMMCRKGKVGWVGRVTYYSPIKSVDYKLGHRSLEAANLTRREHRRAARKLVVSELTLRSSSSLNDSVALVDGYTRLPWSGLCPVELVNI
jgi:hypothetical protein